MRFDRDKTIIHLQSIVGGIIIGLIMSAMLYVIMAP
jgi:hypothetical protein